MVFQGGVFQEEPIAQKALTITELTSKIRGTLEPSFADVWVQGEVSNFRPASSGHLYFSLKDESACLSSAIFKGGSKRVDQALLLKEGSQVFCHGRISIYPPRGSYQLIVDRVELIGAGALHEAFEKLKAKLFAEGLFDVSQKKPLPRFPVRVVILTSPTGAVIQDMLNILKRRAPHIGIVIVPCLVQGFEAATQLINGIRLADQKRLGDLIVLARGGGSIEDLWCFNDEALARAIRSSSIPVISAVGHEVDYTISDFASDLRAPTPSAAAEILSSSWVNLPEQLTEIESRLLNQWTWRLKGWKDLVNQWSSRLVNPKDKLYEKIQQLDELFLRLERAGRFFWKQKASLVQLHEGKLDALSPLKVLERGYALVQDISSSSAATLVKRAAQLRPEQKLELKFHDGTCVVQQIEAL